MVLFTGKGGVGKTTLAAATAVRLATAGQKVLVVSTDPAHSLGDALDHPLGPEPTEVEHGLSGVQLDAPALLRARWDGLRGVIASALGDTVVGSPALGDPAPSGVGLQAEELTVLPGVEEMLALLEVRRLAEAGRWEVLVLDCGPTAETLRLLALPEALGGYLRRVWPRHRRMVHPLGGRLGELAEAVGRLESDAGAVHALLTDADTTSVHLVLTPQRVVLAETRRTLTALALQGMSVRAVLVNQVLPAPWAAGRSRDPARQWLAQRCAEQADVLTALRSDLGGAGPPVVTVGHSPAEPVGVGALESLGAGLDGVGLDGVEPAGPGVGRVELESGSGLGSVYAWRLPLPLLGRATVEVTRVDDDLVLGVGAQRRRLPLPPVLRRCRCTEAEVGDDELVVRFTPDEALWLR